VRAFPVLMPSGVRYWTVLGEDLGVVPAADRFLRDLRFGRDRAESTTEAYARGVSLFLRWCHSTGRDWRTAATDFGLFIIWLKYTAGDGRSVVVAGPGVRPVRGERRINGILTAVRGFLVYAVTVKAAPAWVLGQLYELADSRDLPMEARGEQAEIAATRLRARHRLQEPDNPVDRASDEEIVALFEACRSARDRLIVLLLARAGLRRSEAAGLRRSDIHALPDTRMLGCPEQGPHLHVVRRENVNGAWAKSRRQRTVPLDFLVVSALDLYAAERQACVAARACDFVLVNLFRAPLGSPVTPRRIGELIEELRVRAGVRDSVTAHTLRHAFASNVADAGGTLDEIQMLLGQRNPGSSDPYLHPSRARMRAAVDRVASPRQGAAEVSL
jgi:integrase/recombinase XerD